MKSDLPNKNFNTYTPYNTKPTGLEKKDPGLIARIKADKKAVWGMVNSQINTLIDARFTITTKIKNLNTEHVTLATLQTKAVLQSALLNDTEKKVLQTVDKIQQIQMKYNVQVETISKTHICFTEKQHKKVYNKMELLKAIAICGIKRIILWEESLNNKPIYTKDIQKQYAPIRYILQNEEIALDLEWMELKLAVSKQSTHFSPAKFDILMEILPFITNRAKTALIDVNIDNKDDEKHFQDTRVKVDKRESGFDTEKKFVFPYGEEIYGDISQEEKYSDAFLLENKLHYTNWLNLLRQKFVKATLEQLKQLKTQLEFLRDELLARRNLTHELSMEIGKIASAFIRTEINTSVNEKEESMSTNSKFKYNQALRIINRLPEGGSFNGTTSEEKELVNQYLYNVEDNPKTKKVFSGESAEYQYDMFINDCGILQKEIDNLLNVPHKGFFTNSWNLLDHASKPSSTSDEQSVQLLAEKSDTNALDLLDVSNLLNVTISAIPSTSSLTLDQLKLPSSSSLRLDSSPNLSQQRLDRSQSTPTENSLNSYSNKLFQVINQRISPTILEHQEEKSLSRPELGNE